MRGPLLPRQRRRLLELRSEQHSQTLEAREPESCSPCSSVNATIYVHVASRLVQWLRSRYPFDLS